MPVCGVDSVVPVCARSGVVVCRLGLVGVVNVVVCGPQRDLWIVVFRWG